MSQTPFPSAVIALALLAGACTAGAALALPAAPEGLAWTAPAQPREAEAFQLVFVVDAPQAVDPAGEPLVEVDLDARELIVELATGCTPATCAEASARLVDVEAASLSPGTWTVVARDGGSELRRFDIAVQAWPQQTPFERIPTGQHDPAAGFWFAPERPGTGFHLESRAGGSELALAAFDFVEGRPHWRLDVATLHRDSAVWVFPEYADGSCIGCTPHAAPTGTPTQEPVRIHFTSARTANAELADGTTLALVHMAWGDAYLDTGPDAAPAVPLPALAGHWMIETMAPDAGDVHPAALYLCPADPIDGGVEFLDEDKQWTLQCFEATDAVPAHCELRDYALLQPPVAIAAVADIEAGRMQLVRTAGALAGTPFTAVRIGGYRLYFSPMPPGFCSRALD